MLKRHRISKTSSRRYLLFFSLPLCQLPLLCSSQRVKEGEVMSSPPGLHCVLALCHCIACRPQTHVQGTFLYSQALQLPSNTTLAACKLLQILPKVSDICRITITDISQTGKCKEAHIWFKSVTFAYYCFSHCLCSLLHTLENLLLRQRFWGCS